MCLCELAGSVLISRLNMNDASLIEFVMQPTQQQQEPLYFFTVAERMRKETNIFSFSLITGMKVHNYLVIYTLAVAGLGQQTVTHTHSNAMLTKDTQNDLVSLVPNKQTVVVSWEYSMCGVWKVLICLSAMVCEL